MNVLFWNTHQTSLANPIHSIVLDHSVDILLLCEHVDPNNSLLQLLNTIDGFQRLDPKIDHNNGLRIYYRSSVGHFSIIQEGQRFTMALLELDSGDSILFCLVHIQSKLYGTTDFQAVDCGMIARELSSLEKAIVPGSVVVVGDFNMNPFETGITRIDCFNSVFTKESANKDVRIHRNVDFPIYYNPMINFFNEYTHHGPGTYWYGSSGETSFRWNVFDQILLRGSLVGTFHLNDIKIVKEISGTSLVSITGQPNQNVFSDHLPILYTAR